MDNAHLLFFIKILLGKELLKATRHADQKTKITKKYCGIFRTDSGSSSAPEK